MTLFSLLLGCSSLFSGPIHQAIADDLTKDFKESLSAALDELLKEATDEAYKHARNIESKSIDILTPQQWQKLYDLKLSETLSKGFPKAIHQSIYETLDFHNDLRVMLIEKNFTPLLQIKLNKKNSGQSAIEQNKSLEQVFVKNENQLDEKVKYLKSISIKSDSPFITILEKNYEKVIEELSEEYTELNTKNIIKNSAKFTWRNYKNAHLTPEILKVLLKLVSKHSSFGLKKLVRFIL